jgi:PAS domain-containing protein
VLAAVPHAAFAQAAGENMPLVGSAGWLFLLFALAAVVVAFVLLRRLQKAHADLVRTEADRDRLQAREAALSLGRIRWRTGGGFEVEENAARLLSGRPKSTEELLALMAESDRSELADGLAKLGRAGTGFTGTVKCAATGRSIKISGSSAGLERVLCLDDVEDLLQKTVAPYEQGRTELGQLSGLLDRLPYPVWRRDAAMTVTYCNRAHARLFGTTPNEVIAKSREISSAAKALAKRAQKLSLAQSESQQLVVDGHRRLYDFHEVPL